MNSKCLKITTLFVLFFFTLQLIFSTNLSAGHKKQAIQENHGNLVLLTRHHGLTVKVDGELAGYTPLEALTLTPGLHKIQVANPFQSNWLDQDWFANVQIQANDTLKIKVIFKKSYSVNSTPYGAQVYFKNKYLGETPLFFTLNEDETGELKLSKMGFRDTTLVIGKTEQRFFKIQLEPIKRFKGILTSKGKMERRPKSRKLMYASLAVSAVSGALALYFRDQGNENFNRYLQTGNPELMDRYFNNAKKFDRLAAISFGVFQVSFILSFYLFLKQANR